MLITPGCHECISQLLKRLAAESAAGPEERAAAFAEYQEAFQANCDRFTPPELASLLYGIRRRRTKVDDPMQEIKDKSTALGLELLKELRPVVQASSAPFTAALKIAIGGNILDYGVNPDLTLEEAETSVRQVLELPLDERLVAAFRRRLEQSERILYVLDNCGEAALDRLLLEPLAGKVVIGVRGRPILNDVTRREAALTGLDFAPVIDTGDDTPGVSLPHTSPEFRRVMDESDLVICKGQGNFESLEGTIRRPAYFLFRAKCQVVMDLLGAPKNSLQLVGRNL